MVNTFENSIIRTVMSTVDLLARGFLPPVLIPLPPFFRDVEDVSSTFKARLPSPLHCRFATRTSER